MPHPARPPALDHLVYAAPDLEEASSRLEDLLGVRPAAGGSHPGSGTHNALLSLGAGAYLEVIAPDPAQPPPLRRPFGLDDLSSARLAAWAVRTPDIDAVVRRSRAAGYDPGPVVAASRRRPDGVVLEWRLALRVEPADDGLIPFLFDWGDTPHPSLTAPPGCTLLSLRAEHPRPGRLRPLLDALGVALDLREGPAPALIASLQAPRGPVELR